MVTERLNLYYSGMKYNPEVRYDVVRYDRYLILKKFRLKTTTLQWFVEWDSDRQCCIVDANAPRWYIRLASLCDTIDMGGLFEELISQKLPPQGDPTRRTEVEKFIVELARGAKLGPDYIAARKTFYQTLIDTGLHKPAAKETIINVLDYLKNIEA